MEVAEVLRMTLNWNVTGRDKRVNFWLKQLTATHTHLATLFNKHIEEGQIADWLTTRVTILISKNVIAEKPENYRPITCLPTIYKTITFVVHK